MGGKAKGAGPADTDCDGAGLGVAAREAGVKAGEAAGTVPGALAAGVVACCDWKGAALGWMAGLRVGTSP